MAFTPLWTFNSAPVNKKFIDSGQNKLAQGICSKKADIYSGKYSLSEK
jgi:hypothetical protein